MPLWKTESHLTFPPRFLALREELIKFQMPRGTHHQTERWLSVARQFFFPCRWPGKAKTFLEWALAYTMQGSGALHRLPRALCILSMVYLQSIMLTCFQNKGLHSHQSKHLTSEAAQEDKNEEITWTHIVSPPPNVDSRTVKHTHTYLHMQRLEPKKWSRYARRAFLELKEDQCLQIERTQVPGKDNNVNILNVPELYTEK